MNNPGIFASLILFNIALLGCSSAPLTQKTVIVDAESYINEGVKAYAQADANRAKWLFSKALAIYQGTDNQQGILICHINLVEVALSTKDYPAIQVHLDRATAIANTAEFQAYLQRIRLLSAQSLLQQQDYDQAEKVLQSLLPEFKELTPVKLPDSIQLTAIANQTKIAFFRMQDESIWTQRFANAMALSTHKPLDLENRLLRFQAELLHRQQRYEEAETYLNQALSGYKTSLSRTGIAATLAELGQISMSQGNWQAAENYFERSNQVFRYIGNLDKVVLNTQQLVEIEAQLGNVKRSNALKEWLAAIQSGHLNTPKTKPAN